MINLVSYLEKEEREKIYDYIRANNTDAIDFEAPVIVYSSTDDNGFLNGAIGLTHYKSEFRCLKNSITGFFDNSNKIYYSKNFILYDIIFLHADNEEILKELLEIAFKDRNDGSATHKINCPNLLKSSFREVLEEQGFEIYENTSEPDKYAYGYKELQEKIKSQRQVYIIRRPKTYGLINKKKEVDEK